jgi:SHS2 domain-containing protein
MSRSFRFLDDVATADLAFEASGDSLEEVFHAATDALMDAMADPRSVGATWSKTIQREDEDPAALLFDWLSDVVYWKDASGVVFSRAELALQPRKGGWHLTAILTGEPVNYATQQLRADVKGVTKHLYRVQEEKGHWTACVVLDV